MEPASLLYLINHTPVSRTNQIQKVAGVRNYLAPVLGYLSVSNGLVTLNANLAITGNIAPSVTITDNLGSTSLYWLNTYTQTLNLNSTASISGGTAGVLTVTGNILPAVTTSQDIGSSSYYWNHLYGKYFLATDGGALTAGSSSGFTIGTSTSQKLGFWGGTPIVRPSGSVLTALSNLNLVSSPTIAEADVTNLTTDLATKSSKAFAVAMSVALG